MTEEGGTFEVLFTYDVRDWRSIVCKVSPEIRSRIIENRNVVRIENRSCPAKDRFHIKQCGKCLRFGHKTNVCRSDRYNCAHCREDHHIKDCPHKESDEKRKCSNCDHWNEAEDTKEIPDIKHNAYNHSLSLIHI